MSQNSFLISFITLLTTLALVFAIASRSDPVVVATNLENLPMEIAGYKATEDYFSEGVYTELNADKHVYRHYKASGGKQVDLYIGYYGTAKGGRTGHNPYACLPGAGWGIIETSEAKLRADYYPNGVRVNYILARKGQMYETVFHWYQSASTKVLSTGIEQNIQRFFSRILYNRNDGAFVRVSAVSEHEQLEEYRVLVEFFAEKVLDLLPEYWPLER